MEPLTLMQLFVTWIVVSLIWLWFTLVVSNFYPLYDGGLSQILIVLRGKKGVKGTMSTTADSVNASTPVEEVSEVVKG